MRHRLLAGRLRALNAATFAVLVALVAITSLAHDGVVERADAQPNTASAGDRLDANDAQARDAAFERLGIDAISPVTWLTKRALAQQGLDGEALTGGIVILGVVDAHPLADAGVGTLSIVTALQYGDDGIARTVSLGDVRNVNRIVDAERAFADWHHAGANDLTLTLWRNGRPTDVDVFASGSDPAAQAYQAALDVYAQADHDGALDLVTQLLAEHPAHVDAWLLRARIQADIGNFVAAVSDTTRAIEVDPRSAAAYLQRAEAHTELGDHDRAIEDATAALRLDPNNGKAYRLRAHARARMRDLAGAVEDLDRAIALDATDDKSYALRARIYATVGRFDAAAHDIERAIDLVADNAEYWLTRAQIRAAMGDVDASMADLTRAIALAPDNDRAYAMRAELRRHVGDIEGAIADITDALDLQPDLFPYWRFRGAVLLEMGRYTEAVDDLTNALELAPDDGACYMLRARAFFELTRLSDAYDDIDRAIDIDPVQADALTLRGRICHGMQRLEEALEAFEQALRIDPEQPDALFGVALCLAELDRPAEARARLEYYLRLRPDDARAWRLRSRVSRAVDDPVSAQADLERALEIEPGSVDTLIDYATLLAQMEHVDAAEAAFDRAHAACNTDAERARVSAAHEAAMSAPASVTPEAWNETGEPFDTEGAVSDVLTPMVREWGTIPFSLAIIADVPDEFASLPLGLDRDALRVSILDTFASYGADAVGPPERGHYLKLSLLFDYPKERTSSMMGTIINVAVLVYLHAELVNGDKTKDLGTFELYSFVTADTHESATERAVGERMLRQFVARVIKLWHPE